MTGESTRLGTSRLLAQTLQQLRLEQLERDLARAEAQALSEALCVGVGIIADLQRGSARLRDRYQALLNEFRRYREQLGGVVRPSRSLISRDARRRSSLMTLANSPDVDPPLPSQIDAPDPVEQTGRVP